MKNGGASGLFLMQHRGPASVVSPASVEAWSTSKISPSDTPCPNLCREFRKRDRRFRENSRKYSTAESCVCVCRLHVYVDISIVHHSGIKKIRV